jgi:acetyltransferase-like isoleucine patch superfamily enzyme
MNTLLALFGNLFVWWRQFGEICIRQRLLRRLGHAGRGVSIGENVRLYGARHIEIGDDAVVGHHVVLRALTTYPWTHPAQSFTPVLRLGNGCFVSSFTHISCTGRIEIGTEVMIADRCFISDSNHTYLDTERSVKAQPLAPPGEIRIGDGTWIGAGVCVLGNVRIGRHCVVGANAVVTHDLPDYCVAVGAPARIIKRHDPASGTWRKTNPDGSFSE